MLAYLSFIHSSLLLSSFYLKNGKTNRIFRV